MRVKDDLVARAWSWERIMNLMRGGNTDRATIMSP
jgi:hypothetical protein